MELPTPTGTIAQGSYWRRQTPFALTTFRLVLGPVALVCALAGAPRLVYLPILIAGTLSDILDGVLARRFQVATPGLRRYDSVTDVIYYLLLLTVVWILCRPQLIVTMGAISVLLISEGACIAVGFLKFGKYPATHTYLAKFYGLCMPAALTALLVFNAAGWVIVTLVFTGLAANIEIIAIHMLMAVAPVDISSIFALPKRSN